VKIHDWMMGQISSDLTLFYLRVVLKSGLHKNENIKLEQKGL
jgi:hypothetical protein